MPSAERLEEAFRAPSGHEHLLADAVAAGEIGLDVPVTQARDLLIEMIHGLTALHMANEPDLPVGSGRFGSQIPAAIALFCAKWAPGLQSADSVEAGREETDR